MATITFDTLRFAQQLKASGIPGDQAEAYAKAHAETIAGIAAILTVMLKIAFH